MTRSAAVLATVAIGAVSLGLYAEHSGRARVEEARLALDTSRERERALAGELAACRSEARHGRAASGSASCDCPDPAPCAGDADVDAAAPAEERADRVRALLEKKVSAAFSDEEMDAQTRARAVDLLVRVRELRSAAKAGGLDDDTPPEVRDELQEAQVEFMELTGLGVAEFLSMLERDSNAARRPEEALPLQEGEERKRFADESDVELGVVEPGSVEVLEDGEWKQR